jgi:hypothetical protein
VIQNLPFFSTRCERKNDDEENGICNLKTIQEQPKSKDNSTRDYLTQVDYRATATSL